MFCTKCGTQLTEDGKCPNCDTVPAEPVKTEEGDGKKYRKIGGIDKQTKNYAALLTAFLVFPSSLSIAIDLSFHRYDFWFGYVVGALIVVWICAVLPVLNITPAPVTALICFASIMGYVSYIVYKTGHIEWLFQRALPLVILFALFVAIDAMLLAKKVEWMKVMGCISFEMGVYLIAIEATYTRALTNLHWSPILACGFISVAAVFLAFSYVKTNGKKK